MFMDFEGFNKTLFIAARKSISSSAHQHNVNEEAHSALGNSVESTEFGIFRKFHK